MSDREEPEIFSQTDGKRVGIFGGSFDPIHDGHIHLAKLGRDAAGLDEVWFLPCQISPHKTGRPPTPGDLRVKWLRTAIRDLPWAKVDRTDLETEGPSYSYRTLQTLSRKFPENEWFWIMGGDQWHALPRWAKPEIIAELASFMVLARDGVEIESRQGYRLLTVTGEHPASATAIREALARGETSIPYLDPEVARLIAED